MEWKRNRKRKCDIFREKKGRKVCAAESRFCVSFRVNGCLREMMLGDGVAEEQVHIYFTVRMFYRLQLIAVSRNYKTVKHFCSIGHIVII